MTTQKPEMLNVRAGKGIEIWEMSFAPANALHPDFLEALHKQVAAVSADENISAVVLTSNLRLFSAGGDAAWMKEVLDAGGQAGLIEEFNRTMDIFRDLCMRIRKSPVLFIAALNGHTLAGGLELAAACDLRFSSNSEKVQIGVPEMDLFGAMPTGGGGVQFLARLLGPARALEFILEAKPVSPNIALNMGLVQRLYSPEELMEQTEAFAASVALKAGRIGVAAAKRSILNGAEMALDSAMELDRAVHWDAMRRGNFLPGVEGFVERFGGGK
jgi:enoyl-CoA hydratase/carnithine racemase